MQRRNRKCVLVATIRRVFCAIDFLPCRGVQRWEEDVSSDVRADYPGSFSHCSNPSHSFVYSSSFVYEAPECRFIPPYQLITKGFSSVGVVTQFLEYSREGFACDASDYAARAASCTAKGGSVVNLDPTNQCECRTTTSVCEPPR